MSTKDNNEVAVEKLGDSEKGAGDAKCEIKGTKRAAEVSELLKHYSKILRVHVVAQDMDAVLYYCCVSVG